MLSEIDIVDYPLNDNQYFKNEVANKKWICLHHTVSSNGQADIRWWNSNSDKIATAYVIERDGTVLKAFDDKYWAWHMGLRNFNADKNIELTSRTIGIELVNLGSMVNIKKNQYMVQEYRGSRCWELYTEEQYQKLAELINLICIKYPDINKKNIYDGTDFNLGVFDKSGIFSHRNVNLGKTDLIPAFDFNKFKVYIYA